MHTIYCYREKSTGRPVYVGQTKRTIEQRSGGTGIHYIKDGGYFGQAILKYGFDSFEPEEITKVEDKEYACLLEWFYTDELNTAYPNGYNSNKGYYLSSEAKKRLSVQKKGIPRSPEVIKKMSEHRKGYPAWNKGMSNSTKCLGTHWYNNGVIDVRSAECPEGFTKGRLRYVNR